jgi:hypothetical protein
MHEVYSKRSILTLKLYNNMKNRILTKTLLVFVTLSLTLTSYAQIRVDPSNNVLVGQHWGQNAFKEFDVRGEMFVSHNPKNGVPGWGYVGCYFTNFTHVVGGSTIHSPILEPQWSNNYYLGRPNQQFWATYTNQLFVNSVQITSDERLKTNIEPVTGSLPKLMKLKPFTYDYKFTPDEGVDEATNQQVEEAAKNQIGFMAQDLLKDFPNLVKHDEENDKYSVNYIGLIPELVEAIQEQNQQIQELQAKVTELQARVGE